MTSDTKTAAASLLGKVIGFAGRRAFRPAVGAVAGTARMGMRGARNVGLGAQVGAAVGSRALGPLGAALGAPVGALGGALATPAAAIVRRTSINPGVTESIAARMRAMSASGLRGRPVSRAIGTASAFGVPALGLGGLGASALNSHTAELQERSRRGTRGEQWRTWL